MSVIRTPEERFQNLPGFPYPPHYVELNGMRVHYVDVGAGEVVLCLHGEPSWSYLYRKMIPVLAPRRRVIAPDFIGFGRSDKYTEISDYTYKMHRDTIVQFIEKLDLHDITIVVQDWGGLIGLRVVSLIPDRFARLVIMNTGLPTGDGPLPPAFMAWRNFAATVADLPVGKIVQGSFIKADANQPVGCGDCLSAEVLAAYDAPFPGPEYKAGARAFPLLVPAAPTDEAAPELKAAQAFLMQWQKPAFALFSDGDAITRGGDLYFRAIIPTAKAQPHIVIKNAGHFLQEDKGAEIAGHINDFIDRTPR